MHTSEELPSRRVLFVEDNIINQKVGVRMLRSFGCSVRVASNGLECIQAMDEEEFDAVLMDCQMPVMDGFEATRKIRQTEAARSSTPFQAYTSGSSSLIKVPSAAASRRLEKQDEQPVEALHPSHPSSHAECASGGCAKKDNASSPLRGRESGGQSAKTEQSSEGGRASDSDASDKGASDDDAAGGADDDGGGGGADHDGSEDESASQTHGGTKAEIGHVPIIALTASATAEYRRKCIDSGMDDWLPKPFDKTKLCHILNKWLVTGDDCSSCCSSSGECSDDCSGSCGSP
jgi:CheY-like chemotaxis protein